MGATSFVPQRLRPYTAATSNKSPCSLRSLNRFLTKLGNILHKLEVRIDLWNKVYPRFEQTAVIIGSPLLGNNPRLRQRLSNILGHLLGYKFAH